MTDVGEGGVDDKVLHFPPGRCVLDEELGIIRVLWDPMAVVTLQTAKAQAVAMRKLAGSRLFPALVDMRPVRSCDRAARDFYAGPELGALVSACAMLIGGNRVAAVIGNFMFAIHGGRLMPMKLFVNEAEAIAWLLAVGKRAAAERESGKHLR